MIEQVLGETDGSSSLASKAKDNRSPFTGRSVEFAPACSRRFKLLGELHEIFGRGHPRVSKTTVLLCCQIIGEIRKRLVCISLFESTYV